MAEGSVTSEVRAQLEADRAQLADQVAALEPGGGSDFDEGFADSGQVAAEQGENQSLARQLRSELEDVERALEKLDEGTYGACEECGQPIAEARLEAMPATRFCIDHA